MVDLAQLRGPEIFEFVHGHVAAGDDGLAVVDRYLRDLATRASEADPQDVVNALMASFSARRWLPGRLVLLDAARAALGATLGPVRTAAILDRLGRP